MTIRAAILAAIKRQGLSNYELAKRSGVCRQAIGRYVSGKTGITDTTADRLFAGLGLEVKSKLIDAKRAEKFGLDVCRSLSKEFDRRTR